MMKIRGAYPVRSGWDLNLCLRVLLALFFACAGIVHAKPLPVSGASLPSHVRAVAPNGSTTDPNCGQTTDTSIDSPGWINPCELHYALSLASPLNSGITEIWVKTGTYPTTTDDNREKSYNIRPGLKVFGGFTGTESLRSQRSPRPLPSTVTILSGEINSSARTDNAYHVVRVVRTANVPNEVTILDQLYIAYGYADGPSSAMEGGGLWVSNSKVYINNSRITDNYAKLDGGGLYAEAASQVSLLFSQVTYNTALSNGGGVYTRNSDLSVNATIFYKNTSGNGGDGAYAGVGGTLDIANAIFYENPGTGDAIDVQNSNQNATITSSIVQGSCTTPLICNAVQTTLDPGITVVSGTEDSAMPLFTLASTSPFYTSVLNPALLPDDIYDIDDNPDTTDFNAFGLPYDPSPTAVTVYDFSATPEAGGILLTWETATEIDNLGFNLYRRAAGSAEFNLVNPSLIASQSPGSLLGAVYNFFDPADNGMLYTYRLQALDADGSLQSFDLTYRPSTSASSDLRPRIFLPLLTH